MLILQLLASASNDPEIVCLMRDNATLASMVVAGLSLTILPKFALPAELHGLSLVTLRRTLHLLTKQ